jgi:chromosome segregation ATPase
MSQTPAPAAQTTRSRWTLPAISFAFGVLTSALGAAVHYGQLMSDLSNSKEKISELKKAGEQMQSDLEKSRDAYDGQSKALNAAQLRVQSLEHDRCDPIKADVDEIRRNMDAASAVGYTAGAASLKATLQEYQVTLRACYGAGTAQ